MEFGLKLLWSTASAIGLRRLMKMLPKAYKATTFFFDGEACKGHVGLTIDDGLCRNGPGPSMVAEVATLLKEHDARCTFFVCSEYLVGVEAEAEALVHEGHELGNHMTSDKQFYFHKLPAGEFEQQLRDATQAIEAVPGVGRVRWFRAPQALYTQSMERTVTSHGLRHALGDCYADDWAMEHNADFVARTILKQVRDGSVIVLHQPERGFREHTFAILRQVLEGLRAKGLKCRTLSEMASLEGAARRSHLGDRTLSEVASLEGAARRSHLGDRTLSEVASLEGADPMVAEAAMKTAAETAAVAWAAADASAEHDMLAAPTSTEPLPTSIHSRHPSIDCACYYTENFFFGPRHFFFGPRHFTFEGEDAFRRQNADLLASLSPSDAEGLLSGLEAEALRRRQQPALTAARKAKIEAEYTRLHPSLWTLSDEWLHADFIELVHRARRAGRAHDGAHTDGGGAEPFKPPRKVAEGVFALPVFSERFCQLLCEELDAFRRSGLPCGQPNSMNRHGALLDELGLYPGLLDPLVREWLVPLCSQIPAFAAVGGGHLNSHKSFVVTYRIGEDEHLTEHFDNAEVTLNANLGLSFEAGELCFYGHKDAATDAPSAHHAWTAGVGHAVLHLGQQVHAALPITEGERRNLVIWMRSTAWRRENGCPMCGSTDRLLEGSA
jgi:peptidoglycan/xylan/chitin deacetylase (PgdA/CDA1 family)